MACPRCRLRLSLSNKRPEFRIPRRRAFHTTPSRQRGQLGASLYPQEWQTGTYHFNKATQKSFPVAANHTDTLLSQWLTQKKKHHVADSAAYQVMLKSRIAAQRRKTDRVLISKSTVKDFGDRIEVDAFVFHGARAAERAALNKKGAASAGGKERGGPQRRRQRLRPLGSMGGDGDAGGAGQLPAVRRSGTPGMAVRRPAGGMAIRRPVDGIGRPAGGVTMRSIPGLGRSSGGESGVAARAGPNVVRRV